MENHIGTKSKRTMQREPEEPLRKDPAGRSKVDVQES